MHKLKIQVLVALLAILPFAIQAQNNTNSPYTRYGYGKLAENAFGNQRAMGGIGIGLRDSKSINPLNPASYSAIDSMTFMFDFGLMGQLSWYKDESGRTQKENAGFEYLAMQFPLSKDLGMGIGIEPVSYVGYDYGGTDSLKNTSGAAYEEYYGSGGLSKFYTSLSYDLFDCLSVGVNVGY
ncbi:hypothetical protein LJB98_05990, partial [Bacteroidales bacterium OttesenSCG-928-M11]|nr:hypothetical protein [Bacteroidales bacterium OttesenSCG-928-M11]